MFAVGDKVVCVFVARSEYDKTMIADEPVVGRVYELDSVFSFTNHPNCGTGVAGQLKGLNSGKALGYVLWSNYKGTSQWFFRKIEKSKLSFEEIVGLGVKELEDA